MLPKLALIYLPYTTLALTIDLSHLDSYLRTISPMVVDNSMAPPQTETWDENHASASKSKNILRQAVLVCVESSCIIAFNESTIPITLDGLFCLIKSTGLLELLAENQLGPRGQLLEELRCGSHTNVSAPSLSSAARRPASEHRHSCRLSNSVSHHLEYLSCTENA